MISLMSRYEKMVDACETVKLTLMMMLAAVLFHDYAIFVFLSVVSI